jgi:opacity protein-like surface antigen
MRRSTLVPLLIAAVAGAAVAAPTAAQDGFALKGGLVFNSSDVEGDRSDLELSDAAGFHVGAEYVLPMGIGVGISGYTAGAPGDFSVSEGSLLVLADANYFVSIPLLPLSPYAGLHVGLGSFEMSDFEEGEARPEVDFGDLGWQIGLRFQPSSLIGIDAQYRRVSGSLSGTQDTSFDTNQFLIGVTVF